MAEAIGALRAELAANSAQFASDMQAARSAVQTASAQMQRSFATLQTRANNVYKAIFSIRTALAGGAATAAIMFVKRMADTADQLQSTSQAMGITSEDLQELQYAAGQLGVTVDQDLTKALGIMIRGMGEAQRGTGNFRKGLAEMGLTIADLKGKGPLDVLSFLATRLSQIEDPARRATIASQLFGKGWMSMGAFLKAGGDQIDAMRQKARDLGLVVSNEMVDRAAEASDTFDTLGAVFQVAGINLAAEFLPMLKDVARVMTDQAFQKGVKDFAAQIRSVVKFIHDNIDVIERFAMAFAGMRFGGALGSIAGKKGRIAGGLLGAGLGWFAPEIQDALGAGPKQGLQGLDMGNLGLGKQPLKMTVTSGTPAGGEPIDLEAQAKAQQAVDNVVKSLMDEWNTLRMTDVEKEIYNQLSAAGVSANSLAGQTIRALVEANYQEAASQKAREEALKASIKAMDEARGVAKDFASTFLGALKEGKGFWEALNESVGKLVAKLEDVALDKLIQVLMGGTGTAAGGGLFGGLFKLLGFATGGAFRVGGSGGQDSQLVAFKASPNETVNITKPGQDMGPMGGGYAIQVVPSPYFDVQVRRLSNDEAQQVSAAQIAGVKKAEARQKWTAG